MTKACPKLRDKVREFLDRSRARLLIGGRWVDAADGSTFASGDPSDGEFVMEAASASAADVDWAVIAARDASAGP